MGIEYGIASQRTDGREAAGKRGLAGMAYLRTKPGCGGCGSKDATVASQSRGIWTARCAKCRDKEDAARAAAVMAGIKRAAPESPALRPYYRRLALMESRAPMRTIRGLVLRWGDVFADATNVAFRRGACARAINGGQLVALLGHDRRRVVARQSDGTLLVNETPVGLVADLRVPANSEVVRLAKAGQLRGFSLGQGTALDLRRGAGHHVCADYDFSEISIVLAPNVPTAPGTTIEWSRG